MADDAPKSPLFRRRHIVFGGLIAAASGAAYARMPNQTRTRMAPGTVDKMVPAKVGEWTFAQSSGVVLPPSDAMSDRLYDNLVTRVYTAPNLPTVMLLIAYSNLQDGMLQVHRPEFCYTAGGYALTPTVPITVSDGDGTSFGANQFVANNPNRTEQVLYWTRIGQSFPQSWMEQRFDVLRANLAQTVPDGLLARVSLVDGDNVTGFDTARKFVAMLDRAAPPKLKTILFGDEATRARAATA
ncbi:exosortase-associated protein EpsI, V-type [Sphingomonas floccifaciens]|uniref:Exosortase-associated protein EpsI, V-type n=1 Tax=Sphingomonas floccifaciens TaxID=1844115 RepID=A0ABW4NEY1_9SPHN